MRLRSRPLVVVASVILIISLTYLFYLTVPYLITKSKYSKHRLIAKIVELKATNEKLRQEVAKLNREQVGSLEHIIDEEESPRKEIPEFDPQKMKDSDELAKRISSPPVYKPILRILNNRKPEAPKGALP